MKHMPIRVAAILVAAVISTAPAMAQTKREVIDWYCTGIGGVKGTDPFMQCSLKFAAFMQPYEQQCAGLGIGVNDHQFYSCTYNALQVAEQQYLQQLKQTCIQTGADCR